MTCKTNDNDGDDDDEDDKDSEVQSDDEDGDQRSAITTIRDNYHDDDRRVETRSPKVFSAAMTYMDDDTHITSINLPRVWVTSQCDFHWPLSL